MTAPTAKRPGAPVTLTAHVESILPHRAAPELSAPAQLADFIPKKRSWSPTPDLVKCAQRAYDLQRIVNGAPEYDSLNAMIVAAVERELVRMAAKYNDGEPIKPNTTGTFRTGRPPKNW